MFVLCITLFVTCRPMANSLWSRCQANFTSSRQYHRHYITTEN